MLGRQNSDSLFIVTSIDWHAMDKTAFCLSSFEHTPFNMTSVSKVEELLATYNITESNGNK